MNAQIRVRAATSDDVEALAALRAAPLADPGAAAASFTPFLAAWMETSRATHLPFVAEIDAAVVGAAWLVIGERVPSPENRERRCGDVQSVFVLPEFRRHGVGTAMLAAIMAEARTRHLEHVTVHSNDAATPLYLRAGFDRDPNWLSRADVGDDPGG